MGSFDLQVYRVLSFFSTSSPWYNRTGWLGVKHQPIYFSSSTIRKYWSAGIAQWLQRRTRDRYVAGSSPGRSGELFLLLQSQLLGLTFMSVSISPPCYRCSTLNIQVTLQLNKHVSHVCGFAQSDVTMRMAVWCTHNAPRRQLFHVAPAM